MLSADFNNALLNKWMWKIFDDTDEQIWPNLVLNNYYKGNKENVILGKHRRKSSYFWQGVLKTFDMFKVGSRVDVGDGITTLFWQDIWMGEVSFNNKFFNLSHFINNPIVTVRENFVGNNSTFSWNLGVQRRGIMQNSEEYQQLCSCLQKEERPDKRIWRLGGNTKYAVKSGYTMVNDGGTRSSVHTNIWKT